MLSTLGAGSQVDSFDPILTGNLNIEHGTFPLSNTVLNGVPSLTQNTGTANVTPSLTFTPLAGSGTTTFTGPAVAAGAAWVFDPRFLNGDTTQALCGGSPVPGSLLLKPSFVSCQSLRILSTLPSSSVS